MKTRKKVWSVDPALLIPYNRELKVFDHFWAGRDCVITLQTRGLPILPHLFRPGEEALQKFKVILKVVITIDLRKL